MGTLVFRCDLSTPSAPLTHFWKHTVGSGHATLALRADWQRQLTRCHRELGFRYVRFHGLLSDDMGTLMREKSKPLDSFYNADTICDSLLSVGMKPFVELSFMPTALASGDQTVFHYGANVTPPKKMDEWAALIHRLVAHWIDRYGRDEVRSWFFEVWNEPNIKSFWTGTRDDYFNLYAATARALKALDPELAVGGPATANNAWIDEFIAFCRDNDVPVDFISTHHYPTDALGATDQDTEAQLADSRRSILREWAQDTHRKADPLPVHYTEWNTSSSPRDPLHDEPYAAAAIVKTMLEARGLVRAYSYWAFSDIFEENFMPATAFQGGFGLLTLQGVAKPAYRAFELLGRLGDRAFLIDGAHHTVDAWVTRDDRGRVVVMLTNHALPRRPIDTESVEIRLANVPPPRDVYVERIDDTHANAKRVWTEMNRPHDPSPQQVEHLHAASQLLREPVKWTHESATLRLELSIPSHAVVAITIEPATHREDRP